DLVGDGSVVAGDAGWGGVELGEQQPERPSDLGCGGWVERHGDRLGGVGDVSAEVEQVAQGGAVLVVVGEVGVEPVGQPVFGVERQQPQHHLQAAPLGAQDGPLGLRVVLVGGNL